ncbi:MAG: IscS subfamily cysteine desulfurase [candidate division Zixibacteria bacterium]|nr:IscS subfamily cysteine desulfurase [candidate division Zixibacteria bacterium]MDH3935915.1 IscS subfamily cysteine desulfurase [candidate division Zixibacteria bacterium]MDH4032818.1 IscS subfamily cysteine desulfurase [candidate division Zixibacteria bacterium]
MISESGTLKQWANKKRRSLCGICPAGCWVTVQYDADGRIDQVKADDSSEFGTICKLGEHSADIVYSKDRLLYPMRRKGARGNYDFERISWDEAYETIVERLNSIKAESGPEATCIYTGRGSFELSLCDIFQPEGVAVSSASSVLFPFGSPNTMGVGALCYVAFAMIAPHVTMGGMLFNMYSDLENAELIVIWGANPATDCPPLDHERVLGARKRGAKVVVIDPRRTRTAKLTEAEWIPIRPGTDGALALGLCRALIEEELIDDAFVKDWTVGFEDFARHVQHYNPEVVERITGVPADTIVSLARRIASAHGAAPIMYSGLEYSEGGVQTIRATMVLWALAGQLDVPGGRCFTMRQNHFPLNRSGHIANPDLKKALARDRFPVYSSYRGESHAIALPQAVLEGKPYRIRSLVIQGASISTSWPEPDIWRKTLDALDFVVCIDRQLTADCAYADIVLPATTMYEIDSYMTYGPIFRLREKVVEPVGEARNDFLIMAELAKRLGYGHLYPQTEEELFERVLANTGFTLDDVRKAGGVVQSPSVMTEFKKWEKGGLRPDGKPGFDTPSGKFEIASSILEEHGYEPLPVYTEPGESPQSQPGMSDRFPLVFNSGARVVTDFRTQHHGVESLLKLRPEPTVTINTTDAEARGINNGDLVHVTTARGQVSMRALVTDDIGPGQIDANMGGGGPVGPKAWQECNINDLTDLNQYDPISGFPVYKALLCEVSLVDQEVAAVDVDSGEQGAESAISEDRPDLSAHRIYLDHNATTYLDSDVQNAMQPYMDNEYGNPSAIYHEGRQARAALEDARRRLAQLLNCTARRIVFTGGGSEANNLAIKGVVFANFNDKKHIITSTIEHPAVLETCRWFEKFGYEVTFLPVDSSGLIDPQALKEALTDQTLLVSLMMANNETGAIQPVTELASIAHERGAIFHTDATQAVGKIPVDVDALGVDMLSLSAHKLYGPKGVGAFYVRKEIEIDPLIHGGRQEYGLRSGTENLANIVGLGAAAESAHKHLPDIDSIQDLRDQLETGIRDLLPDARTLGSTAPRLPNTLCMVLPGTRGESLTLALDQKGVSISSGSACRSGSPKPSHALLAMGLSEDEAHCAVRFSLGRRNSSDDIERTLQTMTRILKDDTASVRFVPCR